MEWKYLLKKRRKDLLSPCQLLKSQNEKRIGSDNNMASITISNITSDKVNLQATSSVNCHFSVKFDSSEEFKKFEIVIKPRDFVRNWESKQVVKFTNKRNISSIKKTCKHTSLQSLSH